MDKKIFYQLADLTESFNKIGLKPVICGGLGIYLCFHECEGEAQGLIRTTNDIDLILTKTQVIEKARIQTVDIPITIDAAEFIGSFDCRKGTFNKELQLWDVFFDDQVNFQEAVFGANVSFQDCQFEGGTDFSATVFKKNVSFISCHFEKDFTYREKSQREN